ncbi:nucleoside hydrolase [Paenibacillus sp. GCM10023248]|uniref:nucleoside hydrolase n=1 Tax=Bacillales TaxID=1385 RepID=UPI0023791630|nr:MULTISPECIES: nucleoside hydrolase [Bacillales]MDD9268053.1 nucleoside hydrolase [Paenibacillus sp. MAHUQ-63]MDR6879726.1 purine nucleosidase [Bacillus sp. 3255]
MKKVWLDTDIGGDIDDALCLAYLLRQPACELIGISSVGGEAEKRAMIADAICKAAGRNIPVYAGADRQLLPSSLYPTPDGARRLDQFPHDTSFRKYEAVDRMRQVIREHPHEISLAAIGHLTNIALLFAVDPGIPKLIKELYIMSGVFSESLERSLNMPQDNWNAWVDPHAAAIVYAADVPVMRTFGLNVTTQLVLARSEKPDLFQSAVMQAVEAFGSPWLEHHEMTFHDPLVAACLFEPELCAYRRGKIEVEFRQEQRLGMMEFQASSAGCHEIASDVNRQRFFEHYYKIVGT